MEDRAGNAEAAGSDLASDLKERLSTLIDEYVARQERETRVLGTDVTCAIWVLEKV